MAQLSPAVRRCLEEANRRVARIRDAAHQNALLPQDEYERLRSHHIYFLGSDEAVFETTNVPRLVFNEALALIAEIPLDVCPEPRRVIHCLFEIKQKITVLSGITA